MKARKIPNKKLIKRADKIIAVIQAYKSGATIQRKSRLTDWHDINLGRFIDEDAVQYRVKK